MDFDVIVVGAGPAGTTAAQQLASDGWAVALIEKSGLMAKFAFFAFMGDAAAIPGKFQVLLYPLLGRPGLRPLGLATASASTGSK